MTTKSMLMPLVLLVPLMAQDRYTLDQKGMQTFEKDRATLYKWEPWRFLIGKWRGNGKGAAGEGPGEFTFNTDLDGKVLVTTNVQEFGATKEREAFKYRSLMVIFLEGLRPRANFYDNEGHVINYSVVFTDKPKKVTFVSDVVAGTPRFRFSYTEVSSDELKADFDIASPDAPDKYTKHVEGTVRRQ